MSRCLILALAAVWLTTAPPVGSNAILHAAKSSSGDLEVGGDLAGFPAGSVRYIGYDNLLQLPQQTYTIDDDPNFHGKTEISGVALATLAQILGQSADMIVAICYDQYRTNYPADYLRAHHPLLVLRINGHDRDHWPVADNGGSMAPFVISHPRFTPAFKVLSHEDEPQIPYGVTRIEFRREKQVFGAISPGSQWQENRQVQQGYIIARQDCFRCHNMGAEGGTMAARSWTQLARIASRDDARFRRIIRNPSSVTPGAKMPGQPGYDNATLDALTAYFKTFSNPHSAPDAQPTKDSAP